LAGPAAAHPSRPRRAPPQFVGGSSAAGELGTPLRVTRKLTHYAYLAMLTVVV